MASPVMAVVPAFNEPRATAVAASLAGMVDRVVVLDDGSTPPLAAPGGLHVHRHAENRGYGDAVQSALDLARAECFEALVLVDGDGQHAVRFVPPLLVLLEKHPVALGNRLDPASPEVGVPQPPERRQANDIFRVVFRRLAPGFGVSDFFSGFVAFRVTAVPATLDLRGTRYASPARMWPCLAGAGLGVAELPIPRNYWSANNNFVRQYASMRALAEQLVAEFAAACELHLGIPCAATEAALREELNSGRYPAIREWFGLDADPA